MVHFISWDSGNARNWIIDVRMRLQYSACISVSQRKFSIRCGRGADQQYSFTCQWWAANLGNCAPNVNLDHYNKSRNKNENKKSVEKSDDCSLVSLIRHLCKQVNMSLLKRLLLASAEIGSFYSSFKMKCEEWASSMPGTILLFISVLHLPVLQSLLQSIRGEIAFCHSVHLNSFAPPE